MDMMFVLGVFTVIFFASLIIACFYRSKINVKLWNTVFIIADFVAYSCWNYAAYQRGWTFGERMTLGNISPLTFTIILLTPFMNEKLRNYAYSMIAFLCVGMVFATYISPEYSYLFNYHTEASFAYTSEALCHLICAMFGIYLVLSNQVKADFEHWIKSMVFLLPIITLGVVLNFIFHTNNFGMDPYEGASIYMIDIFGSFWATLTAYYFGIVLVLTAGLIATNLLDRVTRKGSGDGNDKKVDTDTAENTEINKKSDSHTDGVTDDSSFSPEGGV